MYILLLSIIYVAFISLGLPDGLLGSGWPAMQPQFDVPVSFAGIVSFTIACCTIISSLASDRLNRRFGTGKVTAVSVALSMIALFGFSITQNFWMLLFWALPYGFGAGSVDAALNGFVALHYEAKHMSWLHCFWGLGAAIGPYIMSWALTGGRGWETGYRTVGIIQLVLTFILFVSLPLWKNKNATADGGEEQPGRVYSLKEVVRMPGAKEIMIAFFCYCAIETGTGLWCATYLVAQRGITEEIAASWVSLFYVGITVGRGICGFITMKLSDKQMIRLGQGIILLGALLMLIPVNALLFPGLILIGLGCAPIYPSIIHSTPDNFGKDASQSMVGIQMASAYTGSTLMPPIIGVILSTVSMTLYPWLLLVINVLMFLMCERMWKATAKR